MWSTLRISCVASKHYGFPYPTFCCRLQDNLGPRACTDCAGPQFSYEPTNSQPIPSSSWGEDAGRGTKQVEGKGFLTEAKRKEENQDPKITGIEEDTLSDYWPVNLKTCRGILSESPC